MIDDNPAPQEPRATAIERHIHTIVNAVVLALLGWTAITLLDLKERAIKTETVLQSLKEQASSVQQDRWTVSDHRRFEFEMDRRHAELLRRLEVLESGRNGSKNR